LLPLLPEEVTACVVNVGVVPVNGLAEAVVVVCGRPDEAVWAAVVTLNEGITNESKMAESDPEPPYKNWITRFLAGAYTYIELNELNGDDLIWQ
jgi:hypothetical protein